MSARPAADRPASTSAALQARLHRLWFTPSGALDAAAGAALWPLSQLVAVVAAGRRRRIAEDKAAPRTPGRPRVVVVGNLVVGGTGKTPLLIALADALAARGWRPGVIARGYRSGAEHAAPRRVSPGDGAAEVGDEPLLVARRTGAPVVVGADRESALRTLLAAAPCDVVLSDDGLQHAGLVRDLELAVFDARGAGNGHCLPAGPLREPLRGALLLDALVLNGRDTAAPLAHSRTFRFEVLPSGATGLADGRSFAATELLARARGAEVDAVAAIGAPQRFFATLAGLGLRVRPHVLRDHAPIDPAWLASLPGPLVVMTEKDAVKCGGFDAALLARCVALRVDAAVDAALIDWLEARLRG